MHFIRSVWLTAAWLLVTSLVCAEPASVARDPAAAEVLFKQGREALQAQDYETACQKFAESYRLEPAVGTVMNWATCEAKLGKLASSWQHWQEAISLLPAGDDRIAFANKQVAKLQRRLPYLTIHVAEGAPEGTLVERDGVAFGKPSWSLELPVDPGDHRIVAKAPGHEPREFTVSLEEQARKQITVSPGRRVEKPAPTTTVVASDDAGQSPLGWVATGIGALGITTAVVSGILVQDRQETVDANCHDRVCNQTGLDAASEGRMLLVANTAGVIVGVAGLGLGAYLLLSGDDDTPEEDETAKLGVATVGTGIGFSYAQRF